MRSERNNTLLRMLSISSEADRQIFSWDPMTLAFFVAEAFSFRRRDHNNCTGNEGHVYFSADPVIHISSLLEILITT